MPGVFGHIGFGANQNLTDQSGASQLKTTSNEPINGTLETGVIPTSQPRIASRTSVLCWAKLEALTASPLMQMRIVEPARTSGMSGAEGSRINGCVCNAIGESSAVFAAQDPSIGNNTATTDSNEHEVLFDIIVISPQVVGMRLEYNWMTFRFRLNLCTRKSFCVQRRKNCS
jgi:hypothetical protein